MKFMYPQFLWAFAILIIPIIIHLFNFKRYKTLYFSSLKFVKQVDQQTRSSQRLKHLLVLLSRILAFSFLVLAFAQPYFPTDDGSLASKDPILAIYLDNSYSMQAKGSEGELLSQARDNARSLIEKSALDTRFIICTNELSGQEEHFLSRMEAFEKIDGIDYSPITRSTTDILQWQLEALNNQSVESVDNTQFVLLSDFQRSSGKINTLENSKRLSIYPIKLSPENQANLYIDSVWFSSPIHKVNSSNELNIKITNQGENTIENAEITIDIGELNKTIYTSVSGKNSSIASFSYTDRKPGIKSGSIKVSDEMLYFDNSFYLSYEVRTELNVLIVNGEDATRNVGVVFSLDPFYKYEEINISQLTMDDFIERDLVILNGANSLSKGVSNYLIDFKETGGTIGLFPGTTPNLNDWNYLLNKLRHNNIGAKISAGTRIQKLNYLDDFFKGVFQEESEQLNLPSVSAVFRNIESNSNLSQSLLKLQNGQSLMTSVIDKGRSFMFYSSLDPNFGNFQNNALFSTIMLRMGELSQKSQPNYLVIGSNDLFPVYNAKNSERPISIKKDELEVIPQSTELSGVHYLSLNLLNDLQELKAGNYELNQDGVLGNLSLNYNRNESNLSSYSEDKLISALNRSGLNNIEFNEIGRDKGLSTININKPLSYWKICIILTIIFVLIEMALVRFLK